MSIVNIVATSHLSCIIDILLVSQQLKEAKYNISRIKALTYKFRDGGCCRIFSSGKLVVLGKKSLHSIATCLADLAQLIEGLGFPVVLQPFTIVNVVGICDLGVSINLTNFFNANVDFATYNPEIFPAVNLKWNGITYLVFATGKITITGCSSIELMFHACQVIKELTQKT